MIIKTGEKTNFLHVVLIQAAQKMRHVIQKLKSWSVHRDNPSC